MDHVNAKDVIEALLLLGKRTTLGVCWPFRVWNTDVDLDWIRYICGLKILLVGDNAAEHSLVELGRLELDVWEAGGEIGDVLAGP